MKAKDWNKFQKDVLIPLYRDELCIEYCEHCGGTFALAFHHLIRRSKGGENDISNIMLLCATCHHEADNGMNHVEFNKILIEEAKLRYWVNSNYFDMIKL